MTEPQATSAPRRRPHWSLLVGPVVLVVGLTLIALWSSGRDEGAALVAAQQAAGQALLAESLPDLAGTPRTAADWADTIRVVNFWAPWCPPCRKELPEFAAASAHYTAQQAPVQFIGIAVDKLPAVEAFLQDLPLPYPQLIAPNAVLDHVARLGNETRGLPFTVIYDRAGQVRVLKTGLMTEQDLHDRIGGLLTENATP